MRQTTVVLGAVLLLGCGGDDDAGSCAVAKGTYLTEFSERSGDCGPQDSYLQTYPPEPSDGTVECKIEKRTVSPDSCRVEVTQRCTTEGRSADSTLILNWTASGDGASGVMDITFYDERTVRTCQSLYAVTLKRQ